MSRSWWWSGLSAVLLIGCSDDTVKVDSRPPDQGTVADRAAGDQGRGEARAGDRGPGGEAKAGSDAAQAVALKATLTGAQEAPPVTTSGSGSGTITVNAARTEIAVNVTFTGLTGLTASHIHIGDPGVAGPIIFPLTSGAFTSPITKTLTAADLTPQAAQGITTFAAAVTAVLTGKTYVNIHTSANPGGEIRGQITP